jgi:hypothetical protein
MTNAGFSKPAPSHDWQCRLNSMTLTTLVASAVIFSGCGDHPKHPVQASVTEQINDKKIVEECLRQAQLAEKAGDKETARGFYSKAAEKGSPEAHFALAHKYIATQRERIYHYSEAARHGHGEALDYALDVLLFNADSLELADPQAALDLYYQAKKANPCIDFFAEETKLKIMKMCAEPGKFDALAFCKKYDLKPDDGNGFYHVWLIAEEVSKGGRFGKPDPKLILQLVARGGCVTAEFWHAVEEAHKNWKNGEAKEFDICDHVTSGFGMGFAARRADEKDSKDREAALIALEAKLGAKSRPLLRSANDSAVKFIEMKVLHEEVHGGSGRAAWMICSEMDQKNEYLKLVSDIHGGFKPSPMNNLNEADKILNKTYKNVIRDLKSVSKEDPELHSADELREVQRLWVPYRDSSARLFSAMNPSTDERLWKTWLTEVRIKQLQDGPVQSE